MCLRSVLTSLPLGVSSSSGLFLLTNFSLDISFSWPLYLGNWQLFPLPFSNNSSSCRLSLDAIHSFQNQISMSQQEKIERVRFLSIKKIYEENRIERAKIGENIAKQQHCATIQLRKSHWGRNSTALNFSSLFPFPFSLFSLLSSPLLFSSLLFSTHSLRFLDLRDAEVSLRNILWKSSLKLVQTLGQVEQLVEKEVERQVKQLRQQDCVFVCMYLHAWYKSHIRGKGQHL